MIQAKELRIGNFITGEGGTLNVVNSLGLEGESGSNIVNNTDVENFRPISLTKEILLKSGFKSINDKPLFGIAPGEEFFQIVYLINGKMCPLIIKEENKILCHVVPSEGFFGCEFLPIFYVHKLQNLYFALSGEELVVNF
uniref:hypothetical protein n=1 Tax=uncultured Dysgonomonas sp. TaxID=206096 RepID=UPI00258CAB67|nr:hypothetical protein [uncultured Dysgonomonas sp.]